MGYWSGNKGGKKETKERKTRSVGLIVNRYLSAKDKSFYNDDILDV